MSARVTDIPRRRVSYDPNSATQSVVYSRNTSDDKAIRRKHRWLRPVVILSLPVLVALSVLITWLTIVVPWWQGVNDQWNYGNARITQMDANVGHSGNCHFIAEFYKGAIVVIEIPFSNPAATHTYTIPGVTTDGSTPVIQLSTERNLQSGRLDLVVRVDKTNYVTVLYNNGASFTQESN